MNSLPCIPHHLFVAAIRTTDRPGERPTRPQPRPFGPAETTSAVALEAMDHPNSVLGDGMRRLQVSSGQQGFAWP